MNLCDDNKRTLSHSKVIMKNPSVLLTHLGNVLSKLGKQKYIEVSVRAIKQVASIVPNTEDGGRSLIHN